MYISDSTMEKPIEIKLKEETELSLDAVESKVFKKGKTLTSGSTRQRRLFLHLIQSGKAEEVGAEPKKKTKSTKTSTPKETKSKSKSKKSDKE